MELLVGTGKVTVLVLRDNYLHWVWGGCGTSGLGHRTGRGICSSYCSLLTLEDQDALYEIRTRV